ncbi:transcriptional corepressor LEUNIG_HOMOLOG-like [Cornus florida]|uniref:transcriptional corepressor LEUNIG_HOMOLOG-like n=1 Tax=Cornus florida TaxID=4283 RepID=UPI002899FCB7|nr:transcriptional corepressor LEUNIG_HOMOLOG-like [Cornus florida]
MMQRNEIYMADGSGGWCHGYDGAMIGDPPIPATNSSASSSLSVNQFAQMGLDRYIYDYMVKNKMYKAADIFALEANVGQGPVVTEALLLYSVIHDEYGTCRLIVNLGFVLGIDSSEGLLTEWWRVFWDIYSSRLQEHPEGNEDSSNKATQRMINELHNISPIMTKPEMNQQFSIGMDFNNMLRQPAADLLAAKIYEEERLRHLTAKDLYSNAQSLGVDKLALSRPSSSNASYTQQQLSKMAQQRVMRDNIRGISLGRTLPMDSTLHGVPKSIFPRTGLHDTGMGEGVNLTPLTGWPPIGVDQIPHGLAYQVLNSFLPVPNEHQNFQKPAAHHQDILAPVMAQTPGKPTSYFPGSTSNLSTIMPPTNELSGRNGHMMPPMRQTVEEQMVIPVRQTVEQQRIFPVRQTAEQQHNDQLKQQQLHENSRKRKSLSHSRDGENTLVGHNTSGELASGELDGKDAKEDKPLDDDIDSFLFHDDDNTDPTNTTFTTLQRLSPVCNANEQKAGFSFEEFGSFHPSKSKVLCCHFSSEGQFLASAGHGKKVSILSMDSFNIFNTAEAHSHIITDVRFKPHSTVFATSSFDRTVQIWDAARPSKLPVMLLGHGEQVMSLDFHPNNLDLLCSCDSNNEIRLWNVQQSVCTRISKGATRQVRFQPRIGNLLAAAAGNGISLIDVETNNLQYYLEGHVKEVRSVCWDTSGKYIASVSEDSARVWSTVLGGKCIHEFHSNGNKFESCSFHPGYSLLVVIGCYQSIILWNPTESNKTMTVAAHNGIIAALANSNATEYIASASHDQHVKLWK